MRKICIVGGTGYIGSALFRHFCKNLPNYEVTTVDTEWFGNHTNPSNFQVDYRQLTKSFWCKHDIIILLAGLSSVPLCKNKMMESLNCNVVAFVDLLGKLNLCKQKLIYASSGGVYTGTLDATEECSYTPDNWYDLSKKVIDDYAKLNGGKYYGLRFGTVNGFSKNWRSDLMINKMYHTALGSRKITLWNPELYRPILGMIDLCRAVQEIIKQEQTPGVYNLASFNMTIGEIANRVARYMGGDVEVQNMGDSPAYNFSMSTQKFQDMYEFVFEDTVESITEAVVQGYKYCTKLQRELVPQEEDLLAAARSLSCQKV